MTDNLLIAMFGLPGGAEWIVIGVIALLIFGRRLPDVARSVGKSIVEFKKGLRDVKDDVDTQARLSSSEGHSLEDKSTTPKNGGSSGDSTSSTN
jgi:sec-independent protein translocase protein TatA